MFKGRLGYACLNTILRNIRPTSQAIFCSRTCRLESLRKNGIEWVKDLARKNVEDLLKIIQWNEDNHIRFFRISSEMFPFASHATHGYNLEYCAPLLARVGALANQYGHRLTTHPGQYTQLGSPRQDVIQSAVRELNYHCEMLDRMGIGVDGVIIVHGGGTYGDKAAALERVKHTVCNILASNVRKRLVFENDELCYNAEDLLPLCEELDIPLVFDYHHDALNPSSIPPRIIIERAISIFARRGIRPKQHLSEPRPGAVTVIEKRAHADRCESLPRDLPEDMDLMIEAKDKEQAVLHLYQMYNLHPVDKEVLRHSSADQAMMETKGRKSNKKRKEKKRQERKEKTQGLNESRRVESPVPDEGDRVGSAVNTQTSQERTCGRAALRLARRSKTSVQVFGVTDGDVSSALSSGIKPVSRKTSNLAKRHVDMAQPDEVSYEKHSPTLRYGFPTGRGEQKPN